MVFLYSLKRFRCKILQNHHNQDKKQEEQPYKLYIFTKHTNIQSSQIKHHYHIIITTYSHTVESHVCNAGYDKNLAKSEEIHRHPWFLKKQQLQTILLKWAFECCHCQVYSILSVLNIFSFCPLWAERYIIRNNNKNNDGDYIN